jgi:hypothetical protein
MKLTVTADRQYVLSSIGEMVQEVQASDTRDSYRSVLEDAVVELIKLEMRESTYSDEPESSFQGKTILGHAIDTARARLREMTPDFDFAEYLRAAEAKLQGPAAELAELRIQLRESKELARIGDETLVRGQQSYLVKELGLRGAIDGVLIHPLGNTIELDVDTLRQTYSVEGDWFPFQIRHGDFTFILDDDGSLFVSTKYLSEESIKDLKQTLGDIARTLYSN